LKFKLEISAKPSADFPLDGELLSGEIEKSIAPILGGRSIVSVAVTCVPMEEMRELNARYRSVDEATDVLSFPLWEDDGKFVPPDFWEELPLGDVVVSPDFVRQNAERENIGYNNEMARMVIHGVLHLIGFDHDTDERRREMWELQESIVTNFITSGQLRGGLMAE
jgi:probable rRNA maturation factor